MKNSLIVLSCLLLICGCNNKDTVGDPPHFICCYEDMPLKAVCETNSEDSSFSLLVYPDDYSALVHYHYRFGSDETIAYFDKLARKHNDLTYKGKFRLGEYHYRQFDTRDSPSYTKCIYAKDFVRLDITSDKNWDGQHTADSSLNDIFRVSASNYYYFIKNGYPKDADDVADVLPDGGFVGFYYKNTRITAPVSELQPDDLRCLATSAESPLLWFTSTERVPAGGEFVFTITLTTDEGEDIVLKTQPVVL